MPTHATPHAGCAHVPSTPSSPSSPRSRVVTHIVGQGAALVAIGVVLGAIGTLALARLLASFLFGVSAVDPIAFAAASALLLVIGVIAAFVPARRAGMVDPALVLREQ